MSDISVVVAGFWMNGFEFGPLKSFGPFFIQFQQSLHASASQASLVPSLLFGSYFSAGPIATLLSYYLGFRKTILLGATAAATGAVICSFVRSIIAVQLLTVVIGLGCGLGVVPKYTVIGRRFNKKRSLANNIVSMGSSFVAIPLPIIFQFWITQYTWRGTMLLTGALFLNMIPSAMLLTMNPQDNIAGGKKHKLLSTGLCKDWKFLCYILSCGCNLSSITVVAVYLTRSAQDKGFGDYMAASMVSIISVPNLILTPISGYLTSKTSLGPVPVARPYVFAITCALQALAVTSMAFCDSLYAFVFLVVLHSVSIGLRGELSITMAADFFGKEKLVTSLGMLSLSQGLFTAFVPPLFGILVDASGSYNPPFYGSAVLVTAASVLVVTIHRATKKATKASRDGDAEDQRA